MRLHASGKQNASGIGVARAECAPFRAIRHGERYRVVRRVSSEADMNELLDVPCGDKPLKDQRRAHAPSILLWIHLEQHTNAFDEGALQRLLKRPVLQDVRVLLTYENELGASDPTDFAAI